MQVKNNYKLEWQIRTSRGFVREEGIGVFNGDMGIIREINTFSEKVTVEFDEGRIAEYSYSMLDELELAYAITIHKAQGSEFDVVIMIVPQAAPMLLTRNLLYTGITRAKKLLIVIGNDRVVDYMIKNVDSKKRNTGLEFKMKK
jgi:exodeoxyribonuclease V alpha subunit